MSTIRIGPLVSPALIILTLASLLGMAGGTWDAAWHVTLLRESFWTPPHLLLYGGTMLALLGSCAGIFSAWPPGQSTLGLGFGVAAIGAMIVSGAAPLDDYWHRTFGADVDVWSFPHLVGLSGGAVVYLGAILAIQTLREAKSKVGLLPPRPRLVFFLTALLWIAMFSLNWYTLVLARSRESLEYPLLATLVGAPVLVLAASLLGRFGATLVAACYMAYIIAAHALLAHAGFAELPFPPVLVVPALGIDLVMARRSHNYLIASPLEREGKLEGQDPSRSSTEWRRAVLAGLVFVPLFFAAEAASLAWYPHPALPPPRSPSGLSYYTSAFERPWDVAHLAVSIPLCLVVGGLAGAIGGGLGRKIGVLAQEASA